MATKKISLLLTVLLSLIEVVPATANDPPLGTLPPAPTTLVAQPGDGVAPLCWNSPNNFPLV